MTGIDQVAFEPVEVPPAYDPSRMTATIAANVIFEFLGVVAINHRDGE